MTIKKFTIISSLAFLYSSIVRLIGWRYFANSKIFQTMINDNFHHYQLGLILIFAGLIAWRKNSNLRDTFFAIGVGLISDEFVYLFSFLNPKLLNHYTLTGLTINLSFFSFCLTSTYFLKAKGGDK